MQSQFPQQQEDLPSPGQEFDSKDGVGEKSGKINKWILIGIGGFILLAAAVFLAGRMFNRQPDEGGGSGQFIAMSDGAGGGVVKSIKLDILPAKELPEEEPTARGIFTKRSDQSIYIGTGKISVAISMTEGGPSETEANYDGPVVEVVVTHDTLVYQDITGMSFDLSEEKTIQQEVKPGSLDDLTTNSLVSVWGEKSGDRFIARVISFK